MIDSWLGWVQCWDDASRSCALYNFPYELRDNARSIILFKILIQVEKFKFKQSKTQALLKKNLIEWKIQKKVWNKQFFIQ